MSGVCPYTIALRLGTQNPEWLVTLFSCITAEEDPPEPKAFLDPEDEIPVSRKNELQIVHGVTRGEGATTEARTQAQARRMRLHLTRGDPGVIQAAKGEGGQEKRLRPGEGSRRGFIFRVGRL